MNDYIKLGLWALVVGAAFAVAWRKGYLRSLANYAVETREELKKCSWPTWVELRGLTVLVMVTLACLGIFTVGVDFLFAQVMRLIL